MDAPGRLEVLGLQGGGRLPLDPPLETSAIVFTVLIIILLLFNSYCLCNLAFWLRYLNKLTYLLTYLLTNY